MGDDRLDLRNKWERYGSMLDQLERDEGSVFGRVYIIAKSGVTDVLDLLDRLDRQQAVVEAAQKVERAWMEYATAENVDLYNVTVTLAEMSNALTAALTQGGA